MSDIIVSSKPNVLNENELSFEERNNDLKEIDKLREEAKKRDKNSIFSRWTQFNNDCTKDLMWLALKYPKAHAILYFLVDHMDEYNAIMCSSKVLEEVINVSRQTVSKSIKILRENGFIAVLKSGTSNIYAINDMIYWKSWGSNHKYSKFPANIILTSSEQEEINYNKSEFKSNKIKEIDYPNNQNKE